MGSLVVTTTEGQNILSPSVLTADDLAVLTPDPNVASVAAADYSVDGSSGASVPPGVILLLSLVVIGALTALLCARVLRKSPAKKKH